MKHFILLLSLVAIFTSCTSESDFETGKRQLEAQGYTNVRNTGYQPFCCDEKDNFSTGFAAIDRNGHYAEGCFCSGVMKGVTIRFQ